MKIKLRSRQKWKKKKKRDEKRLDCYLISLLKYMYKNNTIILK